MHLLSKVNLRYLALIVAVAGLIVAGSTSLFAAPRGSVLRVTLQGVPHAGLCCSTWGQFVRVVEPERMAPIVVTWSTDYQADAPFYVGISLNGGACAFDGPAGMPTFVPEDGTSYASRTFQWVIMPGDYKLVKGPNVITLCGGAVNSDADTLTLGFNTLTARLAE